jgi:hypothetical protein
MIDNRKERYLGRRVRHEFDHDEAPVIVADVIFNFAFRFSLPLDLVLKH